MGVLGVWVISIPKWGRSVGEGDGGGSTLLEDTPTTIAVYLYLSTITVYIKSYLALLIAWSYGIS